MSFLDTCLIALLALWALGSVLFLFRIPGLHRWLARWNGSHAFVHWSLFSAGDPSRRPATIEVLYRDRDSTGNWTEWQLAASGHASSWRAAVWLPGRYPAAVVQNIGRKVHACLQWEPPAVESAHRHAAILAAYVLRIRPCTPGSTREYRLLRRFASDATSEHLLSFSSADHGCDT